MSKLVTTNIRLPAEDLKKYRIIALHEGKSFAGLVREMLKKFISVYPIVDVQEGVVREKKDITPPIFKIKKYKKWTSGHKHDARDHDKVIYGL